MSEINQPSADPERFILPVAWTTRSHTDNPLGGAAMKRVSTPPVAKVKLAPMSVSVGAPVPSFVTSCQRVCVPRWKPTPMQITEVAIVRVLDRAEVQLKSPTGHYAAAKCVQRVER